MLNKFQSALLTVFLCSVATTGHCQVASATVTGVVQDSAGAVIPGATAVLTQTQTNASAQR